MFLKLFLKICFIIFADVVAIASQEKVPETEQQKVSVLNYFNFNEKLNKYENKF